MILGLGRSPGGWNGYSLQYSCLENPLDRGAWRATVHEVPRVGHDLATKPPPPSGQCGEGKSLNLFTAIYIKMNLSYRSKLKFNNKISRRKQIIFNLGLKILRTQNHKRSDKLDYIKTNIFVQNPNLWKYPPFPQIPQRKWQYISSKKQEYKLDSLNTSNKRFES